MPPPGIEPRSQEPQSCTLPTKLWQHICIFSKKEKKMKKKNAHWELGSGLDFGVVFGMAVFFSQKKYQ